MTLRYHKLKAVFCVESAVQEEKTRLEVEEKRIDEEYHQIHAEKIQLRTERSQFLQLQNQLLQLQIQAGEEKLIGLRRSGETTQSGLLVTTDKR